MGESSEPPEQRDATLVLRNKQAELPAPLTATDYLHRATADNTRTAYRSDIRHFERWGGRLPTDTATVMRYLQAHATALNPRTLQRRLVALRQFHRYQGFVDPTAHPVVNKTLRGIANTHGQPRQQAQALTLAQLENLLDHLAKEITLAARRDAALLSLGFFGALRGSELLQVRVEHLQAQPEGLRLLIPRSKTDPTGEGQHCAIPRLANAYCPLDLLEAWQVASGIQSGTLFRAINRWQQLSSKPLTVHGLNKILQQRAEACRLPEPERFSSHSLRRGLATSASAAGASFKSIMRQGRWRHEGTVLAYIEAGQQFQDNAVSKLFEAPDQGTTTE